MSSVRQRLPKLNTPPKNLGFVAQQEEHLSEKQGVAGSSPAETTMSGTVRYGIYERCGVAGLTVWEAVANWGPPPNVQAYARHQWVPLDHVILDGQVIELHKSSWKVYFFLDTMKRFNVATKDRHAPAPVTWGLSQEISL